MPAATSYNKITTLSRRGSLPPSRPPGFTKVEKRVRTAGGGATMTVRNLRIREDTAKYLLNLDVDSGAPGGVLFVGGLAGAHCYTCLFRINLDVDSGVCAGLCAGGRAGGRADGPLGLWARACGLSWGHEEAKGREEPVHASGGWVGRWDACVFGGG